MRDFSPKLRTRFILVEYCGWVDVVTIMYISVCNMESKENTDEDVKKKENFFFLFSSLLRLSIPSVYFSSSSFSFCRPEKVVTLFFSLSLYRFLNYLASSSFSMLSGQVSLSSMGNLIRLLFCLSDKEEKEEEDAVAVLARSHPDWTICFSLHERVRYSIFYFFFSL
jgi:hypothetical protein